MRIIAKGKTSQSLYFVILDSASTTGGRKTGIAWNTASLVANYVRNGAARTAITLATLASASAAWSSGGFVEVDATNTPGLYRLDVPDAALASGVDSVVVTLKGAAGMVGVEEEIQLTAVDLQDAVRMALTALPNAAAEAAGGLYTRGSGAGQINQNNNGNIDVNAVRINAVATTSVTTINANQGTTQPVNFTGTAGSALAKSDMVDVAGAAVSTSTAQIGVNAVNLGGTAQTGRDIGASVLLSAGTAAGQISLSSGAVTVGTNNDKTGYTASTVSDKTGYSLSAAGVQAVWDALTSALTTVGSVGKRIADFLTGDAYVRLGAPAGASIAADLAEIEAETDLIGTDTAGVTTLLGRIPGTVQPQTGDSYARLGAPVGASISADIAEVEADVDLLGAAADPWNTALPGAYGAGTAGVILGGLPGSVWNAVAASFNTAGSMGQKLNAAGGAADPLTNAVPGAYVAGSAGYAIGHLPQGSGPIQWSYRVTRSDNGAGISGVVVWVTSDAAGLVRLAGPLVTDSSGYVAPLLPAGTAYFWRFAPNFDVSINPDVEVVA